MSRRNLINKKMKTILEEMSASQMEQLKAGTAYVLSKADVVCSAGDGYAVKCCIGKDTPPKEPPVKTTNP